MSTILITGKLTFNSIDHFRKEANEIILNPDSKSITIDLISCDYIDSSGLGVLLLYYNRAKEKNKEFNILVKPKSFIEQALKISNFDKLFNITYVQPND